MDDNNRARREDDGEEQKLEGTGENPINVYDATDRKGNMDHSTPRPSPASVGK